MQGREWHFQANDDTRGGWLAFCIYLGLILLCWRNVALRYRGAGRPDRALSLRFWVILSACVTALGINKQLDFQILLTQIGKQVAATVGVLNYWSQLRVIFAVGVAITGVAVAIHVWKLAGYATRTERVVLIATATLIGFVVLRTLSIGHLDIVPSVSQHRPMLLLEMLSATFLFLAVWSDSRSS
jgi:hypothetical protein